VNIYFNYHKIKKNLAVAIGKTSLLKKKKKRKKNIEKEKEKEEEN
jgi:tmRNA-binding protein